jgi:hypothetical protein
VKYPFFCGLSWGGKSGFERLGIGFWFRIKGYGLHVSTKKRENALFSERYGFRKALYLFGLRFEVLKP